MTCMFTFMIICRCRRINDGSTAAMTAVPVADFFTAQQQSRSVQRPLEKQWHLFFMPITRCMANAARSADRPLRYLFRPQTHLDHWHHQYHPADPGPLTRHLPAWVPSHPDAQQLMTHPVINTTCIMRLSWQAALVPAGMLLRTP